MSGNDSPPAETNIEEEIHALSTGQSSGSKTGRKHQLSRVKTLADNTQHNEGLCLLFKRQTGLHELVIEGEKLHIRRKNELTESEYKKATEIGSKWPHRRNILKNLPKANIQYNVSYSKNKTYVIVVIAMTHAKAEEWAQAHGLDCRIEPREAIRIGRQKPTFLLAHRYSFFSFFFFAFLVSNVHARQWGVFILFFVFFLFVFLPCLFWFGLNFV